jgi:hypothetical protein
VTFALDNALKSAGFGLIIGLSELNAPLAGGLLVPTLDWAILGFSTDASGRFIAGGTWPSGIPAGFSTVHQWWVMDAGGPQGWAATNAVKATTP